MKFFLPLIAVASAASPMVRVPGGLSLPSSCVLSATDPNLSSLMSLCKKEALASKSQEVVVPSSSFFGTEQIYAQDLHVQNVGLWTNFTADWTVPALPNKASGQVDYHWSGFKSQQPEMGYPVLQPVLQYGQHGARWELQSWYVCGNDGVALTGPLVQVKEGDAITSFMSYDTKTETWTVSATANGSETSTLTITKKDLGGYDFDWAMMVHETIMSKTGYCDEYPSSDSISYTNVKLDGAVPEWTNRVQKSDCMQANEFTTDDDADVTFSWMHSM